MFASLPLSFAPNVGQAAQEVRFLARQGKTTIRLTDGGLEWKGGDATIGLRFDGAGNSALRPENRKTGTVNYIFGSDPSAWRLDVPTFERVRYDEVYPGVDVAVYDGGGALEYDFVVAPGADPGAIRLAPQGADQVVVDGKGDLLLRAGQIELRHAKPSAYQLIDGKRRAVDVRFFAGRDGVSFLVGRYDLRRELVIDPLVYSTYLGGTGSESTFSLAVDGAGNVCVAGSTNSADFPTRNAAQGSLVGTGPDAFVTKLNSGGTDLVYSTYLGGGAGDTGLAVATDGAGNCYVTGYTNSTNFPTTAGVVQGAGSNAAGVNKIFATKLTASGAISYSTYLGGPTSVGLLQQGNGIAVDSNGNAVIAGVTSSTSFPLQSPIQATFGGAGEDGFVTKLNATATAYVYSTYMGGNGSDQLEDVALDSSGNAYLAGRSGNTFPVTAGSFQSARSSATGTPEGVLLKMSAAGGIIYAGFLGGGTAGSSAWGVAVDSTGNAYVTGTTFSSDFPLAGPSPFQTTRRTADVSTGYVTKVNASGTARIYSTYLGGSNGADPTSSIAVDSLGNAYIAGHANSTDHPVANPLQANKAGGFYDAFISVLNPVGSSLVFSTYLGGSVDEGADDMALDGSANMFIAGNANSTNYPVTPNVFQPAKTQGDQFDTFITKVGAVVTGGPTVEGTTWYGDGSTAKSGPSGTVVSAFGVGLRANTQYRLMTSPAQGDPNLRCTASLVAVNANMRRSNGRGFIPYTSGLIVRTPGNYDLCFVALDNSTISLRVTFQVL